MMYAVKIEFTEDELAVIARLSRNLMSCAIEAEIDPGVLESIYYKTMEFIDD